MIHGECPQCRKGTLFFCGKMYRCDFCFYQEPTRVLSSKLLPAPKVVPAMGKTHALVRQVTIFDVD